VIVDDYKIETLAILRKHKPEAFAHLSDAELAILYAFASEDHYCAGWMGMQDEPGCCDWFTEYLENYQ